MARALWAPTLVLVVSSALCAWVEPAAAQLPELATNEPVEITADRIDFYQERGLYVAEGHVHVAQAGKSMRARWATFSARTRLGVASGDVRYHDGNELIEARFVQFDVDSLEGVLFGGELDLGEQNLRIAAEQLVHLGEDRYEIFDARFTTCRCVDPTDRVPWELHAGRSKVEVGGYGTSRNTTFEVLGVPVIWLPWILYPVKTERQTGLLVPRVSIGGRNGAGFEQPFLWAARRDLNVILTPGWSEDRGYKQNAEIEAVFGTRSATRIKGGIVPNDKNPPPSGRGSGLVDSTRGFAEIGHDQDLPEGVRLKIDGKWISDNQYVLDFDDLREERRNRFLESSAFAFRPFGSDGRLGVELTSRYGDDLQSTERDDRDPYMLQRYADFEAQWQPGPVAGLSWLGFGVDLDYEYFGRRDGPLSTFLHRNFTPAQVAAETPVVGGRFVDSGIDATPIFDPNDPLTRSDGVFQEGEPLFDFGHRATIHPRLSVPLRLGRAVEWNAEVGWKQTLYYSDQQQFEERGLATGRSDLLVRMGRRYVSETGRTLDHKVIPRLSWVYVSQDKGQTKNPLFTPRTAVTQYRLRQRSLDSVILDPADVIPSTNRLIAALDQRVYRGAGGRRRLIGEFGLGFDYEFASGGRVGRFVAEGRRMQIGRSTNRFQVAIDAQRGKVDEVAALSTIVWPWRIVTSLGYRFVPDGPDFFENFQTAKFENFSDDFDEINQFSGGIALPLFDRFKLRYNANYSFSGGFFLTNSGSIDYISRCKCWAAGVQISRSRDEDLRFEFRYTVVGLGDDPERPFEGGGWLGTD